MIGKVVGHGVEVEDDLPVAGGGLFRLDQALCVVVELGKGWAWAKITAGLKVCEKMVVNKIFRF